MCQNLYLRTVNIADQSQEIEIEIPSPFYSLELGESTISPHFNNKSPPFFHLHSGHLATYPNTRLTLDIEIADIIDNVQLIIDI